MKDCWTLWTTVSIGSLFMKANAQGRRTMGMTLLEVLIVVVILALAYGMLARGLLADSESGQQRLAMATWKELDGLARQMALAAGRSMRLELSLNGNAAQCWDVVTGELIASRNLRAPITLQDWADERVAEAVQIDGRGCSKDYVIRAAGPTVPWLGGWRALGLTGQWIEVANGLGVGPNGGNQ